MSNRDPEYVAIARANLLAEAGGMLRQRYFAIVAYGAGFLFLSLGVVFSVYKVYNAFFKYRVALRKADDATSAGDDVDNPRHDDEPYVPIWDRNGERVPSGNEIRNRIGQKSRRVGRDLRRDLSAENDDYDPLAPASRDDDDDDE